jgi:integrase
VNWREVLREGTVAKVIRNRHYNEGSAASLAKAVKDFTDFLGAPSPSEALERLRGLSEEQLVGVFRNYFIARKGGLAPKSIRNWTVFIRIWLYENGIRVDRISRDIMQEYRRYIAKRGIPKLLKRDIIERDEIRKLLLAADVRERALIAVLASSGLRIGAAIRLKLKHFRDRLEDDLPCYMLEITEELCKGAEGEEQPHITFISREARDYLLAYLNYRKSQGEQLTPESYLFVAHHTNKPKRDEKPRPLTYEAVIYMFKRLCVRAGIDRRPVRVPGDGGSIRYNVRLHSLRKAFKTACSLAGVDRLAAEAMMGHSLSQYGVESIYDYCFENKEWLREQYMRVLPLLTFVTSPPGGDPEVRKTQEEVERLKAEIAELRTVVRALQQLADLYVDWEKLEKEADLHLIVTDHEKTGEWVWYPVQSLMSKDPTKAPALKGYTLEIDGIVDEKELQKRGETKKRRKR